MLTMSMSPVAELELAVSKKKRLISAAHVP